MEGRTRQGRLGICETKESYGKGKLDRCSSRGDPEWMLWLGEEQVVMVGQR